MEQPESEQHTEPGRKTRRVNYKEPFLSDPHFIERAPRVTLSLGILLTGLIYAFLPQKLIFGPSWLLLVLEVVLVVPWWIFWLTGHTLAHHTARRLRFAALALITLALAISLSLLIASLRSFTNGFALLRTAGMLWIFNMLVFAFWYWEIDGGGPHRRHENGHRAIDFLFPQQVNEQHTTWVPDFFDYLFLAFTAATAFSPTDTYPLTHRAKALMMLEGILALIIVAILVGRVANIF
jgi:hypothetical protein